MNIWVLLLIVSLLFCSFGFLMYVYFFSLGYGLSIAAIAVTLMLFYRERLGVGTTLMCLFLVAYGLRLAGYLFVREKKSKTYKQLLSPEYDRGSSIPMVAKLSI